MTEGVGPGGRGCPACEVETGACPYPSRTGGCLCTCAELLAVGGMANAKFVGRPSGRPTPEDWDGPRYEPKQSEIARVRLVCHRVLEHRQKGNILAERETLTSVLGEPANWGRRGGHVNATTYLMRNVCPDFEWDGRALSRKRRRRLERDLAKPLRTAPEQRARALRHAAEAAQRIERKSRRRGPVR